MADKPLKRCQGSIVRRPTNEGTDHEAAVTSFAARIPDCTAPSRVAPNPDGVLAGKVNASFSPLQAHRDIVRRLNTLCRI